MARRGSGPALLASETRELRGGEKTLRQSRAPRPAAPRTPRPATLRPSALLSLPRIQRSCFQTPLSAQSTGTRIYTLGHSTQGKKGASSNAHRSEAVLRAAGNESCRRAVRRLPQRALGKLNYPVTLDEVDVPVKLCWVHLLLFKGNDTDENNVIF